MFTSVGAKSSAKLFVKSLTPAVCIKMPRLLGRNWDVRPVGEIRKNVKLFRSEGLQIGRVAQDEQGGKQEQLAGGLESNGDHIEQHGQQRRIPTDTPQQHIEDERERNRARQMKQVRRDTKTPEKLKGPDVVEGGRCVAGHDELLPDEQLTQHAGSNDDQVERPAYPCVGSGRRTARPRLAIVQPARR
jgi:hypothetical protein